MPDDVTGIVVDAQGYFRRLTIHEQTLEAQLKLAVDGDVYFVHRGEGVALVSDPRAKREGAPFAFPATIIAHYLGHRTLVYGKTVVMGTNEAGELTTLPIDQAERIADIFEAPVDKGLAERVARTIARDREVRTELLAGRALSAARRGAGTPGTKTPKPGI